ncbi:MmcQ/YjbR family DNA-binding protein [Bacteroidaceae bacterium]
MDIETIRNYCIKKKATTEEFPFDEVTLVFKVMGKMYACIGLDDPEWLTLKCDPEYALELRELHSGIEGAFHFNKKYWNQISLRGDINDKLIFSLIDHSYEEVLKKFTRKLKQEYDERSE